MGSSYSTDDPEKSAKLAITIVAIVIGLSFIMFIVSMLRLAGEAMCCLAKLCGCCKDGLVWCGAKMSGKEAPTADAADNDASPAGPVRKDLGQLMSMALMIMAVLTALIWEFYFAVDMDANSATARAWSDGCTPSMSSYPECLKFAAAYRVAFATFLFFAANALITAFVPAAHNRGWDLKFLAFLALLIGFAFVPNHVVDGNGFVWVARIGAFIFLILQQIILIDSAYCINEFLVAKGYASADRPGTEDSWNNYLAACLFLSLATFAGAITGLVLLFVYFTGCGTSDAFNGITLAAIVVFTTIQLFFTKPGEGGGQGNSLLTSAVVAAYMVYLTFVAVSSNPTAGCNPMYSSEQNVLALILGLVITFLSVSATVYFASKSVTDLANGPVTPSNLESALTGGTSLTQQVADPADASYYKFNIAMALITCYWCCVLTDWGNPGGGSSAASPTAGNVAMWMNATASWICAGLYTWTLVAPRIFPDRDFSR
jgi:hypothetical protein